MQKWTTYRIYEIDLRPQNTKSTNFNHKRLQRTANTTPKDPKLFRHYCGSLVRRNKQRSSAENYPLTPCGSVSVNVRALKQSERVIFSRAYLFVDKFGSSDPKWNLLSWCFDSRTNSLLWTFVLFPFLSSYLSRNVAYRKIPKISARACIFQRTFFRGVSHTTIAWSSAQKHRQCDRS